MSTKLLLALFGARNQIQNIEPNENVCYNGRQFKYATYPHLIKSIMPILHEHNIILTFTNSTDKTDITTIGTIHHVPSGENMSSEFTVPIPDKEYRGKQFTNQQNQQERGGINTYSKRQVILNLFALKVEIDASEHIDQDRDREQQPKKDIEKEWGKETKKHRELTEIERKSNMDNAHGILDEAYKTKAITDNEYEKGKLYLLENGYSNKSTKIIIGRTIKKMDTLTPISNPVPEAYQNNKSDIF